MSGPRSRPEPGPRNAITDVPGILVGHHHRRDADATLGSGETAGSGWATGCTVVRAPGGATAAVDVRGGGPGTRETDLLDPSHTVQKADAILLAGGSAYGLAAADGVMRWLEENGEGIPMGGPGMVVPIVPGAVIFDLPVGGWTQRPDAEFGYRAAAAAGQDFAVGSVGAGVGARAGALKGGVGTASLVIESGPAAGHTIGAVVVANPVGSVLDPRTGLPWGLGLPDEFDLPTPTLDEIAALADLAAKGTVLNTTIGVIATDASLSRAACRRLAVAAHDGLARAIRPAHSPLDGDTIFALATGTGSVARPDGVPGALPAELPLLAALCGPAADCFERAIVHAVLAATTVAGIPAYRDMITNRRGADS
ncbi:P1 family peptidase [Tomitella biformata]|uniref:P1 family peptidase n=1 Tax=Tomitella biformata TaxID=630403 RepID=UPI00046513FF|nr:P1 family peptidase [Tomitella biformata]